MKGRYPSSNLRLGYFLEHRKEFLDSIGCTGAPRGIERAHNAQSKIMAILEKSSLEEMTSTKRLDVDSPFEANTEATTARDVVTIRQMLACGVHFGHTPSRWNPKMAPYIYGERAGIHIINLERTLVCLRQACNVARDVASRGGGILFVGTTPSIQRLTYECAQDAGQYYVNTRWVGGTITNRTQVLRNDRLVPHLLIVLDPFNNQGAVEEAGRGGIPTIAICDTNCDPTPITYPIPANDDAYASVELVARTLSAAAAEGRRIRTSQPLPSQEIYESANSFIGRVFTGTFSSTLANYRQAN